MERGAVPQVLKQGGHEDKGEAARLQYFVGAIAVGDLIKTTFGPKGMDKILQPMSTYGSKTDKTTITNDGATILKNVWLDNPAAKILVDVSKEQDSQCGDGTTGVVVLAAELLRNAEQLVEKKVHPQSICDGYVAAAAIAREALEKNSFVPEESKHVETLMNVARTTLSSKLVHHDKEHFAQMAVDAVLRLKGRNNLNYIQIIKKPGARFRDSYLEEGFILEKKIGVGQPKVLADCKILVANTPMDTDKIKVYGASVKVDSFIAVDELEKAEKMKMKKKCDKIISHGCNVFINRQLIYNYPDQLFKDAGIMAIEHSDFDGTERLAAVLGGDIVSTFDTPEMVTLGHCDKIDEVIIGEDKCIRFTGCKTGEACTIILRGANQQVLDEAERSMYDAIAIVSQTLLDMRVVLGGGAIELSMSEAIEQAARTISGKKRAAVEAFADALRQIPTILLDNGGHDATSTLGDLRALHAQGKHQYGADLVTGGAGDMQAMGVYEAYVSKKSQLNAASEAAEMIVRVDGIISCAPRQREQE